MLNFAKSLPIEIANSPMAARSYLEDSEEEVSPTKPANPILLLLSLYKRNINCCFCCMLQHVRDYAVDIAASIKALAKSVHGEAVFGDLPRPRLRSQI